MPRPLLASARGCVTSAKRHWSPDRAAAASERSQTAPTTHEYPGFAVLPMVLPMFLSGHSLETASDDGDPWTELDADSASRKGWSPEGAGKCLAHGCQRHRSPQQLWLFGSFAQSGFERTEIEGRRLGLLDQLPSPAQAASTTEAVMTVQSMYVTWT